MKPKVEFIDVTKKYNLFQKKSDRLLDILSLKKKQDNFFALKRVSFKVFEGETIGIIGVNGSGKSTLSNLLSEIMPPTEGIINIDGDTSLVAISAGLNNQLTGLENIELKCLMHGYKKKDIDLIKTKIIDFADIGEFINQPIKSYSSGMKSRLGFAISVHINPDILIVDEALSVGDQTFYQKCIDKFNEFKSQGKTIFFISHSLSQIRTICDKVLWLNFGQVEQFGQTSEVLTNYEQFIKWFNHLSNDEKKLHRKKMLNDQMTLDEPKESITSIGNRREVRKRKQPKKKKKGYVFLIGQISILLFLILITGTLMFLEKPEAYFKGKIANLSNTNIENTKEKKVDKTSSSEEIINKTAYINSETATIYKDTKLTQKIVEVPFGEQINIISGNSKGLKIKLNNDAGYLSTKEVFIPKETIRESTYTIEDTLPIFPQPFVDSYQYILAHLNMNYNEVKAKMNGLTLEDEDKFKRKVLKYDYEKLAFQFNKNDISDTLIINNLNLGTSLYLDLKNDAQVFSKDKTLYLLILKDYELIINEEESSASLKITK